MFTLSTRTDMSRTCGEVAKSRSDRKKLESQRPEFLSLVIVILDCIKGECELKVFSSTLASACYVIFCYVIFVPLNPTNAQCHQIWPHVPTCVHMTIG